MDGADVGVIDYHQAIGRQGLLQIGGYPVLEVGIRINLQESQIEEQRLFLVLATIGFPSPQPRATHVGLGEP